MAFYPHYRNVPASVWRWPNFTPREIACRGTGKILINAAAMDRLQRLRADLGRPLVINSAYRSPEHNTRVGGAKSSKHLQGVAFDVSMLGHDPAEFIGAARRAGFVGIGTYPKQNFVHIDTGPARSWGDPFPSRAKPVPAPPVKTVVTPKPIDVRLPDYPAPSDSHPGHAIALVALVAVLIALFVFGG